MLNNILKHKLFENFISLLSIQGLNYILPLITLPYLVRVLGLEQFGLLVMIQIVVSYARLIVDYGFSLTAVDAISKVEEDKVEVSKIFVTVITAKFTLFLSCVLFGVLALFIIPFEQDQLYLFTLGGIELLGAIIYVDWFFQGIQRMKILAIMEFVSKSFFTILIFLLVKREEDLDLAVLATGVAHLIAGILSLILAFKSYRLNLTIPSLKLVRMQIYTGFPIFISQAMVPLYTSINVIILGAFTSNYIVGIYASAEKIFTALRGLNRPFNRSIFPYLSGLYNKDSSAYKSFVFKTERVYGVIFFFISLSCFIAAPFIMKLISGDLLEQNSILVFRILCLALLFVPYGPFYSQILVIEGKKKELIYVVFILVVINIIIAFIIIPLYFEIGLAIQVVIISFLVPVINLCFLKKGLFFR